ncbi:5'/3'-nucleotidase SurE [Clostridium sp. SYSU_GA19001]|uniref:5'/3'-nucleotidase SurE n=1 Tax=Clostridium caldaquaticum TaxID=2940653 RepID=UPI002077781A|nr:5'/3'-nucleotidase SurE [Clostridium caldaquaticum]MCM8710195.1 5'/3'-nucleotidase SurE [Clostridium caldaquaticum]
MKLLLTNDDGINAKGIYVLAKRLEKSHEVIIAAPDSQRSASGHAITLTRPLVIKKVKLEGLNCKAYSIDGTPADCVRIALDKLIDEKVDMVISGINRGTNLGTDVLYSGTVSAAVEAAIYKTPAIAVSSEFDEDNDNYEVAAETVIKLLLKNRENFIKDDMVININVPLLSYKEIKGIKVARIGSRTYNHAFIESRDEEGNIRYQIVGTVEDSLQEDTDVHYFKEGYITLTPLHYDLTNFKILKEVEDWIG